MKVMFACLADHAGADQQGNKLNVMGIFDRIGAPTFPATHAKMVLVFRLILETHDANRKHGLAVFLRDADHKEHAKFTADVEALGAAIKPGEFVTVNQIIELVGVTFVRPGRYHFAIVADEEEEVRVPLILQKI